MLENKIVLVTGSSRGIGRAVAIALAQQGATIILLSRTVKHLEDVYDEILALNKSKPAIYPFNLCSATLEDYDDLRMAIAKQYGRLDCVIHNAGILGDLTPLEYYDVKKWYQVLQVNLNGIFLLNQATLPLLKQSVAGSIIFTLSNLGSDPKANWGAYAVANAGCRAMLQMLSQECENLTRIRVNGVELDKINTRLRTQAYPAESEEYLLQPEEIVKPYLELLGNSKHYKNGQILPMLIAQTECAE